jgi:hypothetical protein
LSSDIFARKTIAEFEFDGFKVELVEASDHSYFCVEDSSYELFIVSPEFVERLMTELVKYRAAKSGASLD